MSLLGAALAVRSEATGDLDDIYEAIAIHRAAVGASTDPARRASALGSLGSALSVRASRTGDTGMLDEAVSVLQDASSTSAPWDAARCDMNLGVALIHRYEWTDSFEDLTESIAAYRRVAQERRDDWVANTINLANALKLRADRTGSSADEAESTRHYEEAAAATPPGHPRRAMRLPALARALMQRAMTTSDKGLATRAVTLTREALAASPSPSDQRIGRIALADHLHLLATISESAAVIREGLGVLEPMPDKPEGELLNVRASLLRRLYEVTQDPDVLDDCVDAAARAAAAPGRAADSARWTFNLGIHCRSRYSVHKRRRDLMSAVDAWSQVSADTAASAQTRFNAAALWANLAAAAGQRESALVAFRAAIDLCGQLAWPGLRRADQELRLSGASGVARDAAACAINNANPRLAVELLEQGRSVLWSLALETNAEAGQIAAQAPALAARLNEVHAALRASATVDTASPLVPYPEGNLDDRLAILAHERDQLIAKARQLPGLQDFLRPQTYDQLARAADSGPVVVLNASSYRIDTIIVNAGQSPLVIPLPNAFEPEIVRQANEYLDALRQLETAISPDAIEVAQQNIQVCPLFRVNGLLPLLISPSGRGVNRLRSAGVMQVDVR
jgi:hypothetical protein